MSNQIRLKRGSGSDPSASDLVTGEIAIRTDNGKLFTKRDNGNVTEITGGGGIDDGDKGDITVSNSGGTFTIDNDVVTFAKMQNIAQNSILARLDSGSGDIQELSASQVRDILNVENGATADQTASEILTLIKTVDGSGSGLDADTLDGVSSASFLRSDADDTSNSQLTFSNTSGNSKINFTGISGSGSYNYAFGIGNDGGNKAVHFVNGSTRSSDGGVNTYTIRNDGGTLRLGHGSYSTKLEGSQIDVTNNLICSHSNGQVELKSDDGCIEIIRTSGGAFIDFKNSTGEDFDARISENNGGFNFTGSSTINGVLTVGGSSVSGGEGGEINLTVPATTNLSAGAVALDIQTNSLRIFETGGNNRGFYLDLTTAANGVGSKIWHSHNDGAGSGLDADTLDGAQPSVGASNSTIVQRHSSGYIFANYFNTSPDDVSSGVTKVCVETGNDGYIRHGTAAAIRAFINVADGATAGVASTGGTFSGDVGFSGGAGAATINGNSDIRFSQGSWTGEATKIQGHNNYMYIQGGSNGIIFRRSNGTDNWFITSSGHFVPGPNNSLDLGGTSNRIRNIYTNDLNLSNEGGSNDVDGTWGSYTIQEGADDLFLINRRNGKKYKFNLTEVS